MATRRRYHVNSRAAHSLGAAATGEQTTPPEIVNTDAIAAAITTAAAARATPEIAQRAGAALEKCGNAAALACEELADQVRADADRIIEFLQALAGDYRARGNIAALSVETFGADTQRAFEQLQGLRVELERSGERSHG